MTEIHQFNFPTTIRFGCGAVRLLVKELEERGCKRPLLITDPGVAKQSFFESIVSDLKKGGFAVSVYAEVHANPIEGDVRGGTGRCREAKADWIVAVGGGSPMDTAKGVSLQSSVDDPLFEYREGSGKRIPENLMPILAIPTTAGTGSEVGRSAVISEDETGIKHVVFSPALLPKLVLADPELTLGLPPHLTAATGMDAMTHNVESYLAKGFHPICDGVALEGTRLVCQNLERAVKDGKNIEARSHMLLGAIMGAVAFQKGLGACHSMAHPLTTVAGTQHGLANALCLPKVLEFNSGVVGERLSTLATHTGLEDRTPKGFVAFMKRLTASIGIPPNLRGAGIREEMLPRLVELAVKDGCHQCNPRPVSKGNFEKMYREIL